MARRSTRNKRKKHDPDSQKKNVRQNYVLATNERTNPQFFEYYKKQGLIKEEEWDSFVSTLQSDLPTAFRFQGSHRDAQKLIEIMAKRYLAPIIAAENTKFDIPQPLPWYQFAYQTILSRSAIRSHPQLKKFHNFLVSESELGHISRQESVSMIPPLLLDIKPHHKVLDVCAAPGSKTSQIIELMHENGNVPEGLVVANDADNARCYLLVRQVLKRMPVANCIIINEDAAYLPEMKLDEEPLLFDRVLCDVMCSGDGTLRKNLDLWSTWKHQQALGLHKIQTSIARRALQLLAVDGIMVYSTCSLNPIEDEAVIAALLRFGEGCVELVDVSARLPELKRSPGVSTWKVFDKNLNEILEAPNDMKNLIIPSMFPPSSEESKQFHLNRCFRILPHTQNTGGFFVAILRKTRTFGSSTPRPLAPPLKKKRVFKEDPFVFIDKNDQRWTDIANYYGVTENFNNENLFGRVVDSEKRRTLYFVNDNVKKFIECNQNKVKVINAGLRMFGRVEQKFIECRFRMCQDGVGVILPFLTKRLVYATEEDIYSILKAEQSCNRDCLNCFEKLSELTSGSVIFVHKSNDGISHVICTWMGAKVVTAYVSKEQRIHIIRMLGRDSSELESTLPSVRQLKAIRERQNNTALQEKTTV